MATIQETYSSALVNYTEPRIINGIEYTRIYTELNTDLRVGDYVFILNGNYDSSDLIDINEYQDGSTGYKILEIDKNAITVDVLYKNESIWNQDPLEDYTKVYVVNDLDKFNYENVDNNFGFNLFGGDKYSIFNNNIFLSKIEDLPHTSQVGTNNRFFKSSFENDPELILIETRGQQINDSTELKFDLDELDVYGISQSAGLSGSTYSRFATGQNYVRDFTIVDKIDDISSDEIQYLAVLNSANIGTSSVNLWTLDKKSLNGSSVQDVRLRNSQDTADVSAHIISPMSDTLSTAFVTFPRNFTGGYYYKISTNANFSQSFGSGVNFNLIGQTMIVGYNDPSFENNFRGFGFYNNENDHSLQFISPDLGTTTWPNGGGSIKKGYADNNSEAVPYFVLSSGASGSTTYNGEQYMPFAQKFSRVEGLLVPKYARYTGIGTPIQIETNSWENSEDFSKNLEIAFAGTGTTASAFEQGGIYFYSYAGNWKDYSDTQSGSGTSNKTFGGNAFDLSKTTYDEYITGSWSATRFNPFSDYMEYPFTDVKDVKWLGTEKKELGLDLYYGSNGVVQWFTELSVDPGAISLVPSFGGGFGGGDGGFGGGGGISLPTTTTSVYYSKYLVITESGKSYYIYLNFNSQLLTVNPNFLADVNNLDIPQVHVVIEEVKDLDRPTTIGTNREFDKYSFPTILDGQYPITSIYGSHSNFGLPDDFDTYDFGTLSITSLDYSDNRWLVSTSDFSPRLGNSIMGGTFSSDGLYVYDRSVDDTTVRYNIDITYNFDIGDNLPSNSTFKIIGEVLSNGKRRVWTSTPNGLFYFDYELEYFYDYYYRINFDDNDIPLDDALYKNDKIYIVEDFEYDGFEYKKGEIYKHLKNERRWVIDTTFNKSYITKAHFQDGTFQDDGIFNDGIFGNKESIADWNEGTWRNGVLFNSIWNNGIMESKSDTLVEKSYYANLDNGSINVSTDFNNNGGFGYNTVFGSTLLTGDINNANILSSVIGATQSDLLLDMTYKGMSYSFNDLDILKAYIVDSDIYGIQIKDSKIVSSNINNSEVDGLSKLISNNTYDTIIKNGLIENQGDIKIIGYDKWYNIRSTITGQDIIQIHKFFIRDEDIEKLNFEDWVIFNKVDINNNDPSNILDKLFYILGGEDGYYSDSYENLNKIKTSGNEYQEYAFKLFISRKINTQNTQKSVISFNGTQLEVNKIDNTEPRYSIDLAIVTDSIPYNSDANTYINALEDNGILRFTATDITNANIQTKHFKNTWINGGEWLNGSIINPDQLKNKFNYGTISSFTSSVQFDLYDDKYEIKSERLIGNDIVHINNIWDTDFATYSGGNFKIESGTTSRILSTYSTIATSSTLTPPMSQYTVLNSNRIDGIDNSLVIRSGFFKNQSFSNISFKNDDIELDNFEFNNIRNLMLINSEITRRDNIDLNGIFLGYGHISNDFTPDNIDVSVLGYKQTFKEVNVNDGLISKSALINGVWNNGEFRANKHINLDDLIPINNRTYGTTQSAVATGWHTGQFNDGIIDDSVWLIGTFSNGTFINSDFLNGTWLNGTFGDISSRTNLNTFRKGYWLNGSFENGVFGDDDTQIQAVNSVYTADNYVTNDNLYTKGGTNVWENGNFNNGFLSSTNNDATLWLNGKFNNGSVIGSVVWYDGIFNNGKFNSKYGRFVGNIVGEADLSAIAANTDSDGSRAFNLQGNTGTMSFLNRYNISSIRNLNILNDFNNPATLVLDTSDYQLKFLFVSDSTTIKDPFDSVNSAHGYTEKQVNDFFDNPGVEDLFLQFKPVDYEIENASRRNPIFNSNILGSKIFVQDTGNQYMYDGSEYLTQSSFLGLTISGTTLTFSSDYAWRDGVFNEGEFGAPDNSDNSNPSWENGTFNGGNFNGKLWKNGTFVRGEFNGFGVSQSKIDTNDIFKGYDGQATMDRYLNNYTNVIIATSSASQTNYKTIQNKHRWYGVWLDGEVSPNINSVNNSNLSSVSNNITPNLSPSLVSALNGGGQTSIVQNNNLTTTDRSSNRFSNNIVSENQLIEYFNEDKFDRRIGSNPNFNNMVWVNGTFNNTGGNFNESVWLAGTFSNGNFNDSLFNPYVQRWDFEKGDLTDVNFTFELDTEKAIWKNGNFNGGVFYYSNWENGTFNDGSMVGGIFKKGTNNYMSAYSTIWEDGRFRNGNWYGSNFTIENVYNEAQIPNPFEYLGAYFENTQFTPFITDILANNSKRLQDDRLHIWNTTEGSVNSSDYDLTGNDFGTDTTTRTFIILPGNFPIEYRITLSDETTSPALGVYQIQYKLQQLLIGGSAPVTERLNLSDTRRYSTGFYDLTFYTEGSGLWSPDVRLSTLNFTLTADIYDDGILIENDVVLKEIPTGIYGDVRKTFEVGDNQEYVLKIDVLAIADGTSDITENFFIEVNEVISDINYTTNNNKLNGYVQVNWDGDYLNSDIATVSATMSYTNDLEVSENFNYISYDLVTISVPTEYNSISGAYTQFGNGAFHKGIFENGVWNNGYRGTQYGFVIADSDFTGSTASFTHSGGSVSTVEMNSLYVDSPKYKYRNEPVIYFNTVQRSFRTRRNTVWRFVLESAFDIDGNNASESYNKLIVGDQVSISNIIAIDINGNRKIIKDVFSVVAIPTRNQIVVEYQETFPIDTIQIDSDRHLIGVSKNIWLNGAFLNGHFEGNMIGAFIRGNRFITKIEDSHLTDVTFEGGHFKGQKYDLTNAFDNKTTVAQGLSPQLLSSYNNLYHSALIQNMRFKDDVSLKIFDSDTIENYRISGENGEKTITTGATGSTDAIQYIYNSDIDVVYEPEYFSSLFNQNIASSHMLNNSKIGEFTNTILYNVPAGYITYDILSSVSDFKYSTQPSEISVIDYKLNLGSKYNIFNDVFIADYDSSPNNDIEIDKPSTFNIVESATYGLFVKEGEPDGISFQDGQSQFVHENFMYDYNTSGNTTKLISGDNTFKIRDRYHMVEVDVEFKNGDGSFLNPYDITQGIILNATYSYSTASLPKLSIGQNYNEFFEVEQNSGYVSPYDNDMIDFITGDKVSEINNFGEKVNRLTLRTFLYNNFGGYRDSVKMIEKDFTLDSGATNSVYTINSPIYYSFKHYEIDKIPFFNYKDFIDPLTGVVSEWNMRNEQVNSRKIDDRIKVPFFATSVPIDYTDSNFVLTENINFLGGSNISGNSVLNNVDILRLATLLDTIGDELDNNLTFGGDLGDGPLF